MRDFTVMLSVAFVLVAVSCNSGETKQNADSAATLSLDSMPVLHLGPA